MRRKPADFERVGDGVRDRPQRICDWRHGLISLRVAGARIRSARAASEVDGRSKSRAVTLAKRLVRHWRTRLVELRRRSLDVSGAAGQKA